MSIAAITVALALGVQMARGQVPPGDSANASTNSQADAGQWKTVAENLAKAAQANPSVQWGWYVLMPVLVQAGELSEYHAQCTAMLGRFGRTTDARIANRTAISCLLLPSAVAPDEFTLAVKLAKYGATQEPDSPWIQWRLMTKGLADFRHGHFADALEAVGRAQENLAQYSDEEFQEPCEADTWFIAAMAHRKLNHPDQADAALARGLEIARAKLPNLVEGGLGDDSWHDVLMTCILMREATATLAGQSADASTDSAKTLAQCVLRYLTQGASDRAFTSAVAAKFSTWDTNHDQILSKEELDAAIEDPANNGAAAAALSALKRATSSDRGLPPLTLGNIRRLAADARFNLRGLYREGLWRINSVTHRELFASELPQLKTIHQGRMGNCFSLAPLGGMVYRDPRQVAALFAVQDDGRILVRFAGGPVCVSPLTDAELALTAGNTQDGVWIKLYEKAMGQARNDRRPPSKRAGLPMDAIAHGGEPEPIMSYLSGRKVGGFALNKIKLADLRQQLTEGASHKRLMTCTTRATTTPGLSPNHAYAVLDYKPQGDTVLLWNPHGNNFIPKGPSGLVNGYATTNGLFSLPLADMNQQFDHVCIERSDRATLQWLDEWEMMVQAGRFEEAAAELTEIIELDATKNWELYMLTPLLIQTGRITDYKAHCKTMLDQYDQTTEPPVAERTAKSCLLLPAAVGPKDLKRAAALAARAVTLSKGGDWVHWRLMTRGLAEYRKGSFSSALKTEPLSREALAHEPDAGQNCCLADTYFISAMAHRKLKQTSEARADLDRGLEIVRAKLPKLDGGDLGQGWFDALMTHILLREAVGTVPPEK